MPGVPLQHDVLQHAVPIAVQPRGVVHVRIHQQPPLQFARFGRIRAHIIGQPPAVKIFPHGFPVEKDNRLLCGFGLVDQPARRRAVNDIDQHHVVVLLQEPVNLVVLQALIVLRIAEIELQLHPFDLLIRLRIFVQVIHQKGNKGIVLPVNRHADFNGVHRAVLRFPAGRQQKQDSEQDGRRPSNRLQMSPSPKIPPGQSDSGNKSHWIVASYMLSRLTKNCRSAGSSVGRFFRAGRVPA